jgi:Phosphofructokinase
VRAQQTFSRQCRNPSGKIGVRGRRARLEWRSSAPVVKAACYAGLEVIGIDGSFDGLLEFNRSRVLTPRDITGILRRGGTILGTVNTRDPFVRRIATS